MIGRIYRIIHLESEICYIGSTFNDLRFRWQQHKDNFKCWANGKNGEISIFKYFKQHGIDKFKMILVKEYNVIDRIHLEAYEQLWINKFCNTCINKKNPFSLKKLYQREKNKQNYQASKEKIKEKVKSYREVNRSKIKEKAKAFREANHLKIREYQNQKHECECGGKYTYQNHKRHNHTKKHQNYLNSQ
jgi:hypothetical protein